jgi:hypothetical protein
MCVSRAPRNPQETNECVCLLEYSLLSLQKIIDGVDDCCCRCCLYQITKIWVFYDYLFLILILLDRVTKNYMTGLNGCRLSSCKTQIPKRKTLLPMDCAPGEKNENCVCCCMTGKNTHSSRTFRNALALTPWSARLELASIKTVFLCLALLHFTSL